MGSIRVLAFDDSAAVRIMFGEILDAEEGIRVVGALPRGEDAIERIALMRPDIVILDVTMPGRSGLDVLSDIRAVHPRLPVIMFSAHTQRASEITFEALARGASDYVTKPLLTYRREEALEHVRAQLVPKVRALGVRRGPPGRVEPFTAASPRVERVTSGPPCLHGAVDVVAIATSTGGPNALTALLRELPVLPVPILIVQHMPPVFTRLLAERLSTDGVTRVREASHGDVLEPGYAWIAAGDFHMRVERRGGVARLALDQAEPENSCRPAADVLFRSVASAYGARALAVVLTGMGQDGLRGCVQLHARGAPILAQDQASSVVWGMPGAVAKAGIASAILPLASMAAEIARRVGWTAVRPPGQRQVG
jgi:two-component system chemotaxis response regulator CheB